jgi:hypothetical protein
LEAIIGRKTIHEIAAHHAIHPIQVSQWKMHLLDVAGELFTRGKQTRDKGEGQAKEADLFKQIGRLQIELACLKTTTAVLMPVNSEIGSITSTLSSASAVSVHCLACRDPASTTGPGRSMNRRCGSWPGLMFSSWRILAVAAAGSSITWPGQAFRSVATRSEVSCAA